MDFFVGDTSCCQNTANPVSHRISSPNGFPLPPPPRIKYHMVKVPIYGISPPPLPTKIAHAVPILHMELVLDEICHRGGRFAIWYYFPLLVLPSDFFRGGGGGLLHGIIPPWGEVLLWDFFPGEDLPKGIPSWATFAIWYNFRGDNLPWYLFPYQEMCVCVCGGGGSTIEGEALP